MCAQQERAFTATTYHPSARTSRKKKARFKYKFGEPKLGAKRTSPIGRAASSSALVAASTMRTMPAIARQPSLAGHDVQECSDAPGGLFLASYPEIRSYFSIRDALKSMARCTARACLARHGRDKWPVLPGDAMVAPPIGLSRIDGVGTTRLTSWQLGQASWPEWQEGFSNFFKLIRC